MQERSVDDALEGKDPPAELQNLAQKLAALAQHIKTITATPIGEKVRLDEASETPWQASAD